MGWKKKQLRCKVSCKERTQAVPREAAERIQKAMTFDKWVQSCLGNCMTTDYSACGFGCSGLCGWERVIKHCSFAFH